jgi:hypothetical protein
MDGTRGTTRRRMLGGLLALPLAGLVLGVATTARRGIAAMRPGARGTSTTTCAQCGGVGHGMLDPACPAAPKVV